MYVKTIELHNYGPIKDIVFNFPFDGDTPIPLVLVGENGSGKSVFLSHIVNGFMYAQSLAYPESPEVETGKVYKLRHDHYIKIGSEFYFSKVDFEGGLFISETRLRKLKREFGTKPSGIQEKEWRELESEKRDLFSTNLSFENKTVVTDLFNRNCVLFFPHNRYEEPAWLNEANLKSQAEYMETRLLVGYTNRNVIASTPLRANQNWLFDVVYDRAVFELQTERINVPVNDGNTTLPIPLFIGYSGNATKTYETALEITRTVTRKGDVRFGIGQRSNRVVSIESESGQIVANIFQLSSGEVSLLNLFLSILRDFDLCGVSYQNTSKIRGIVVVDEIDLHLHAVHQHEVLPELIRMFPNIQFIVTSHSPLFVLGMKKVFGDEGFVLYRLPQGHQISAEEFSEFGSAYHAFTITNRYSSDIRTAIENAQSPLIYVEGVTDQLYLQRASQLLGLEHVIENVEIMNGGGAGELRKVWKSIRSSIVSEIVPQKVVLLFDSDEGIDPCIRGNVFKISLPAQSQNPIKKGIENLFSEETIKKAQQHKSAFIDIDPERTQIIRGQPQHLSEVWTINADEKTNLCNWLCENATSDEFEGFREVFDQFERILNLDSTT